MPPKNPVNTPSAEETAQTFESAIARLEHVVAEMESDKLPLEDLLTRYEEGIKLVKICEARLSAAERRIEILTRNAAGDPRLSDFAPEKKSAPRSADPDVSLF